MPTRPYSGPGLGTEEFMSQVHAASPVVVSPSATPVDLEEPDHEGAFWSAAPRYSTTSAAPPPLLMEPRTPRLAATVLFAAVFSLIAALGVYELVTACLRALR